MVFDCGVSQLVKIQVPLLVECTTALITRIGYRSRMNTIVTD